MMAVGGFGGRMRDRGWNRAEGRHRWGALERGEELGPILIPVLGPRGFAPTI